MEARERATRVEIESQDKRWEEVVARMQEEIKRLQQEARGRDGSAEDAAEAGGSVAEFASPGIM